MMGRVREQRLQSLPLLIKFESPVPHPSVTVYKKNRGYPGGLYMRAAGFALFLTTFVISHFAVAQLSRVEITSRETLSDPNVRFSYEKFEGIMHFTLAPGLRANQRIVDLEHVPLNEAGLVEFAADFRLLVPSENIANDTLIYHVNNRGRSATHPEISLQHPLASQGFTYLITGWINELSSAPGRLRLHAPVVGSEEAPIAGPVRYEVSTGRATDSIAIAGPGHLAYPPTEAGMAAATLTRRLYQSEPREPIERSQFDLTVSERKDSSQVDVVLALDGGFEPGYLYELIYEAQDPVLVGAGMSAIRDAVAAIRHDQESDLLQDLNLPQIRHTVAYGVSQSGRLLRQFVYEGFNADLNGNKVFDGVIPIISGGGFGMFNMRFAMPTRTNGHHSNHLYPNDLFPFTYGNSTDPYTGKQDGVLARARVAGVEPKLMHVQTVNEYWLRAGSLTHTTADGRADVLIPENVRFYTIGGSQHSSGNGRPREASSGQLPPNPSMWSPISDSLIVAMSRWISDMKAPPASRIPRIADGTLLPSHLNGEINPEVWRPIAGYRHPFSMYQPSLNDYGRRWTEERVIDSHPQRANEAYVALVPAVDPDNNDLASVTVLPPTAKVPLATFVSWNLRALKTGAENSLARLAGGYIPFATTAGEATEAGDFRNSLESLYGSFSEYMVQYEAATDALIADGFLLSGFKEAYLQIARDNAVFFP